MFFLAAAAAGHAAEEEQQPPRAIFVVEADGSGLRQVAAVAGFRWLDGPRWSHDGGQLAFAAWGEKPSRCFVVDAGGKNLRDLGPGARPDWSPDDKQIAFDAPRAGQPGVWVTNTDGRGKSWLAEGSAARWSPDGGRIALVGPPRILDLIEGGGRPVFDLGTKGHALGCEWSPDGRKLAVVVEQDGERLLRIVDLEKETHNVHTRLTGQLDGALSWSPDGKQLAVSLRERPGGPWQLHLVNPSGDEPPTLIPGQEGDNLQPAFSPDGKLLAFASSRPAMGAALALEESAGKLVLVRRHDKGGTVYSVAFSPDGRIAFLGGDMTHRGMQVWDVTTGDIINTISLPGIFVAISPDGRRAAAAEFITGDVQYLDLEDGSLIREFKHGAQVISMAFTRDGSKLVSAGMDKQVCVFDVASGAALVRVAHDGELKQVAFSPDGKLFASASSDKKLHLWDAATGEKIRETLHPATPWSVAFSPDGRQIMTGTGGELVGKRSDLLVDISKDNAIRIWDVATGNLLRTLEGHSNVVRTLAYSPDGKRAVSASFDRSLRLWDVESGQQLSRVDGQGWFTDAVFSFDGRLVLAGGGAEKNVERKKWFEFPNERVRLYRVE